MANMHLILLVFALVCEILAAVSAPSGRVNLIAAGLAFWIASVLF